MTLGQTARLRRHRLAAAATTRTLGPARMAVDELLATAVGQVADDVVAAARIDPRTVIAAARRRGIPVAGATPAAQVRSLGRHGVDVLDPLADWFVATSATTAGIQSLVANLGGGVPRSVSLPVDTLGTAAMTVRAGSAVMNAYGFETETDEDAARLRAGLAVAVGVHGVTVSGEAFRLAERLAVPLVGPAAGRQLRQTVAVAVCRRVGCDLSLSRLLRGVPLAGAAVGAAANATVVAHIARRVQAHYRAQRTTGLPETNARDADGSYRRAPRVPSHVPVG